MRAKAILFDKDGTLFDFRATWESWAAAVLLRLCDGDHGRAARAGQAIGFDLARQQFDPKSVVIAGTPQEVASALAAEFPAIGKAELITLLNEEAELAPQAEAVPLRGFLDRLRQMGMRLGVATNDAEQPALAHLTAAGIRDRFEFVAGCDSGFGAKPAPGQLNAFALRIGIPPSLIAMVGDSTHDLLAGRAAGMQTVGVLTGMAGAEDLVPHADAVLPDIGHLPAWLTEPG